MWSSNSQQFIIPRTHVGYELLDYIISSHPTSVSEIVVLLNTNDKNVSNNIFYRLRFSAGHFEGKLSW